MQAFKKTYHIQRLTETIWLNFYMRVNMHHKFNIQEFVKYHYEANSSSMVTINPYKDYAGCQNY